ncbi:MAG: trypsin-like peptidase domain-containing protein [Actinobacteria bacterium]|nr:trypsin-like peptidase domain-containing protein [Actinomycetota bacterium]
MEERGDRKETGFEAAGERIPSDVREPIKTVNLGEKGARNLGPGRKLLGLMLAIGFLGAVIGGLIATFAVPYMYGSTPQAVFGGQQTQPTNNSKAIIETNGSVSPATAVAKKLTPSVVNISVRQGPQDPIHSGLTGGVGSGVIYTEDGYIITNNHVVSGAMEILVTIGTDKVPAKVVAADAETDLAVLKINSKGLHAAEFGSTKDLQVGEPAVAIGSPFGFEHTVTSGIISALNRTVSIRNERTGEASLVTTYTNLIQTDASINPGNSGGALSDASGKVIGINTVIISSSGTNEGVGFAIPVETVKSVADQLIKDGKASHPYMGIGGRNVSDVAIGDSNISVKEGAIIVEVVPGGPADRAGLQMYDIITAVNGKRIKDMNELITEIRQKKVGDSIEITYLRNGKEDKVTLTLIEKPRQ